MFAETGKARRQKLRKAIRLQRRQLTLSARNLCARRLAQQVCKDPLVMNSRHIAAYLPADGEIDTNPLIEGLLALGKVLYLPILVTFSDRRLWFSAYTPGDRLVNNRFGIPEPERAHYRRIKPVSLDLVLTPLVAFDARGHRLGMGGGYYDYSFAFLNSRHHWKKPRLMGLAYEFQRLPQIDAESWDVHLNAIATERRVYYCKHQGETTSVAAARSAPPDKVAG
jgi:5-formyltetrahydrofolate cyclo-ligase